MLEVAGIIVSSAALVAVAVISKLQFGKDRKLEQRVGEVPDDTSLYKLLSNQGVEIYALRLEVEDCKGREDKKDETIQDLENRLKVLEEAES